MFEMIGYALTDTVENVEGESFATEAEATENFFQWIEEEGYSVKAHPEGGWIVFDEIELYAALIRPVRG